MLKLENVFYLGAPPPVYRLVIIAYDANVIVFRYKLNYNLILSNIGILELVDQHIPKPVLIKPQRIRVILEQPVGVKQEIVKIHGII